MIVAFVSLIQEFLNLNLGTALIRFGAGYHAKDRNDKLFSLVKVCLKVSGISALISVAVIAFLTYYSYNHFFTTPGLTGYVIAYAFAASVTYFNSISRSMLRLYFKFRISSLIEIIMDTVESVVMVFVVWKYPGDLDAFFPAIILVRFLNGFICNLIAFAELKGEWAPHLHAPASLLRDDIKEIRGFVIGNSVGITMKTIVNQGDVLLLGLLTSPEQVAYYVVAKKLAFTVLTLTDPLTSSIYPQLSKLLAEKKYMEVRQMLKKISTIASIPAILILFVMFFLNHWMMVFLYGNEYAPASSSFMFFLTGALLGAVTFWTLPLVQSLGLVRMRIIGYLMTITVGVCLSNWLIPVYQAQGMAMALLCTNVLNATIFILFSLKSMRRAEQLQAAAIA